VTNSKNIESSPESPSQKMARFIETRKSSLSRSLRNSKNHHSLTIVFLLEARNNDKRNTSFLYPTRKKALSSYQNNKKNLQPCPR
jgi:uncharacterized protein YeaC (DUF1315 family)